MEHKHEPIISLDGQIKCRTCGKILPFFEEELAKVSSAIRLRRILEEIAVAGNYTAISFHRGFVVYSKKIDNLREEVTGEKVANREFRIYKTTTNLY